MKSDVKEKILGLVESYRKEIVDFASSLISIPTENPPGSGYEPCSDMIATKLTEMGFECTRYGDCVLAYIGTGRRTLYFHGHYDTVPVSDRRQFEPRLKGGRLYGRGSSDMKGGLASMLYAAKAVKESGIKLGGRLGLAIVPDEETAGSRGSKYLLNQKLLGRDGIGMLMPEPTSGVIWNANRGAISSRIVIKGKSAHVGLQCQGINAFDRMVVAANEFLRLKRRVERRTTEFKIAPEAARHSILLLGGLVSGGTNFNVVPSECSFTLDRRINPEEDFDAEKRKMLSIADKLRKSGINLEMEIMQEGWSAASSEDTVVAKVLSESIKEAQGRPAKFEMCPGLLETRFYARRNIPAYAYGPGLLKVSHGPDEYVEMESMFRCTGTYALTAVRLLA